MRRLIGLALLALAVPAARSAQKPAGKPAPCAPGALDIALVASRRWTHLAPRGGLFSGNVRAPAGNVVVYAKCGPTTAFTGLLRYTGR